MSHALAAEADRRLVEVLLVAAGRVPGAALPAAELLVGLSAGSGELLLKQLDVLLQVRGDWLVLGLFGFCSTAGGSGAGAGGCPAYC